MALEFPHFPSQSASQVIALLLMDGFSLSLYVLVVTKFFFLIFLFVVNFVIH